jgi:hypothetical protein
MRDQAERTMTATAEKLLAMAKRAPGAQRSRLAAKARTILDRLDGGGPNPLEGRKFASLDELVLAHMAEIANATRAGNHALARRLRRDLERSRATRDRLAKSTTRNGRERADEVA